MDLDPYIWLGHTALIPESVIFATYFPFPLAFAG